MALLGAPGTGPPEALGQRGITYEEYEARAAFLLSMAKFTVWPEGALPPGDPFSIGVLGESPIASALEQQATAPLQGRRIVVRRFRSPSDVRACHILYFPAAEERLLPGLRPRLGSGVLTTGETSFFIGYGGALHLFSEDGRLRFVLNRSALDQARLHVAAQVQRLAKHVIN